MLTRLALRCLLVLPLGLALTGAAALVHARTVRYPAAVPWVGNRAEVLAQLPPEPAAGGFSFLVCGDPEDGVAHFMELLASHPDRSAAFLVIPGDLVKYPTRDRFGFFLAEMERLGWRLPTVCAIGNSDVSPAEPRLFDEFIGPRVFHFEYRGCLFAFFDDAEQFIGEDQIRPIDELLARERDRFRHVFFVMHRPIVEVKVESAEDEAARARGNAPMIDLVRRRRVDYVLCAHLHGYMRIAREGTIHIVTGGGGGALQQAEDGVGYHLLEMTVRPDGEVRERMWTTGIDHLAIGTSWTNWHVKILPWVRGHGAASAGIEGLLAAASFATLRLGRRRKGTVA